MALHFHWGVVRVLRAAQAVFEGPNLIGRVPISNEEAVTFKESDRLFILALNML